MVDYVSVALIILVFIVELIIIWYLWWGYTQLNNSIIDVQDTLNDMYTLEVAEVKKQGIEAKVRLPKRVTARLNKNKCA